MQIREKAKIGDDLDISSHHVVLAVNVSPRFCISIKFKLTGFLYLVCDFAAPGMSLFAKRKQNIGSVGVIE